jgi:2-keto-4-pentenoate hydratase/2-oxohepta-3-ene-1,7-dioic acid hydratase in catechol pathway
VLPFQPLSVRHFYGSEQAILEAAYASLGRLLPPVTNVWETFVSGVRDRLPALALSREHAIQTAFRLNNPLSVVPTATPLSVPSHAKAIDYEPRLGFVISKELADATPEEATAAIAAFVLICEFSARDGADPRAGAVPVPATPPSSIAEIAVSAKVLLDSWHELEGSVSVNGRLVGEINASASKVDLGELLAAACVGQRLMPGELFSIDALAPAAPAEPLKPGDRLVVDVPTLGHVVHPIS